MSGCRVGADEFVVGVVSWSGVGLRSVALMRRFAVGALSWFGGDRRRTVVAMHAAVAEAALCCVGVLCLVAVAC